MQSFMPRKVLVLLGFVTLWAVAPPALAQFGPVYPYFSGYGYGGWGTYSLNSGAALENQLASQSRAMAQNAVVQSGVRSTLTQQAESRTQNIAGQRQAYKDWWFQTQQQQMAAQQTRTGYGTVPSAGVSSLEPAAAEIIPWPTLLKDPLFTKQRDRIEEPYCRSPSGLSQPMAADYRQMLDATAKMKELLRQKVAFDYGLPAGQFAEADKFLDDLASEARGRAEQMEAAARPAAKPAEKPAAPLKAKK